MNFPVPRGALLAILLSVFPAPLPLRAWSPKQAPLMTRWARDVDPAHPLPGYPRPQMVRAEWLNLNGVWEFKRGAAADTFPEGSARFPEEILVPFPMESALSGVMDHAERVWYRRHFTVPPAWQGRRVLLHFGAVDWESEVFVNGRSAGVHRGGYLPFTDDVTPLLTGAGPQELVVRVYDPTDDAGEPRGKQSIHPGGIMYTPTTGIWQTVWLEPVPEAGIKNLRLVPDVAGGVLRLGVEVYSVPAGGRGVTLEPEMAVRVKIKGGAQTISTAEGSNLEELKVPVPHAKLWSPDHPFLYDLEVSVVWNGQVVDEVKSYFGMRQIELGDDHGVKKMRLNGEFVFEFGVLDQGFWPDGIYTAPTDAALKNDLDTIKAAGFNLVRKHLKVEPARWYYWADRLGLLVWQDMPSANSYVGDGKPPPLDEPEFAGELSQMIAALGNAPSVILWDLFNEGQGQHATAALVAAVRKLDPSRLINEASGGAYTGHGDVCDFHHYPPPVCPPPNAAQALVCGEYGGLGFRLPGHTWTANGGGYANAPDLAALADRYNRYAGQIRRFRDEQGLSAVVYTQLTDVEDELNGLLTYDRIPKVAPSLLVAANHLELAPAAFKTVVPASDEQAQSWSYTVDEPSREWTRRDFNDSTWTRGEAGFGKVGALGRTPWTTPDIWLRRHFNPGPLRPGDAEHLVLRMLHDDDVQVFINGVPAYADTGYIGDYEYDHLSRSAALAITSAGDNVLAVHCQQRGGGQYIDVGISLQLPP